MPILIKPFLFLVAFGQAAILFASVIGLAGWLLTTLARAISVAHFQMAPSERKVRRPGTPSSNGATNAGTIAAARLAPSATIYARGSEPGARSSTTDL
jgi:hypothetical protein